MATIAYKIQCVQAQMDAAAEQAGRARSSVALLAVSKKHPEEAVREAFAAGQRAFGENYVQEGVQKIRALADLAGLKWHLIGPLQSNKAKSVAEHFDWVHTIDRIRIAQRLSDLRPAQKGPLQVCIQVNIDGGPSKSGVPLSEAKALAGALVQLPRLTLRGIMVMPDRASDQELACHFRSARLLFEELGASVTPLDTLSMGMSEDMHLAIAQGSTMVRVGTAIFGPRE